MDDRIEQAGVRAMDFLHFAEMIWGIACRCDTRIQRELAENIANWVPLLHEWRQEGITTSSLAIESIGHAARQIGIPYSNAAVSGASAHHFAWDLGGPAIELLAGLNAAQISDRWPELRSEILALKWSKIDWHDAESRIWHESLGADKLLQESSQSKNKQNSQTSKKGQPKCARRKKKKTGETPGRPDKAKRNKDLAEEFKNYDGSIKSFAIEKRMKYSTMKTALCNGNALLRATKNSLSPE